MHVWLLFLSVAGVAGITILFLLARKAPKSEQIWQQLDDSAHDVGGSGAKRKLLQRAEPPIVSAEANSHVGLKQKPPHTAWEDSRYCWVVVCKNHWVHRRPNIFHVHRIPLSETDAVTPRPKIDRPIFVQCDLCRKRYAYQPS